MLWHLQKFVFRDSKLGLRDDDQLAFCGVSSGKDDIVIATAYGQGIRFNEKKFVLWAVKLQGLLVLEIT